MIQDIEKTALLSEYANLLATGVEPEAADQEMQDFEVQAVKRDFEVIITSDEEKEKKKKKKKKKNEK
ncbi:uncharacterized protein BDCG_16280 [Blastomyces dermatitidis ER-3]|uniref:Uncharacterized protein n=1 Tax=Ajellomyces dermatitidis (strain ER-3 / ATCC MYA-2586) TaxID=559297 RepID=A0ABX2VR59_AJEDR|nr:uncharacterized protein BDCG_16280 [Blastomyces dermatitidis ER-3]OAS99721.1 hypothetical protein BDCG_16280 [Blastomyces dermatitidis ER-3]